MNKSVKINNPMKVITGPDTRWSYANVWEPKSINGGTPKYSVSLIIPKSDTKTIAKIEAAIEAAYKEGKAKLKGKGGDIYCASASQMFKVPVEKHGINGHLLQKSKIEKLALGYGDSVGVLKAMGAIDMVLTEDELPTLVDAWRQSNPHIVHLLPKRHSFYHTAFRQKPGLCEAKSYAQIATQRDFDAF